MHGAAFYKTPRPLPRALQVNEGANVGPAWDQPVELGDHVLGIAAHGPDVRSRYGEGARPHHGVEVLRGRGVVVGIEIHQHRMRERGAAQASGRERARTRAVVFVNAAGTNRSMNDRFSCAYERFARARHPSSAMGACRIRRFGVLTPWTPWLLLTRLRRSRAPTEVQ